MEKKTNAKPISLNKPGYIVFLVIAVFFLIRHDLSQAGIFCALALVFDPFDIHQPFSQRPFYQKAWMFIHVAIAITLFMLTMMGARG